MIYGFQTMSSQNSNEYIQAALIRAVGEGVTVSAVRTPDLVFPVVIWRMAGEERVNLLDGPMDPIVVLYEIECRSVSQKGSHSMSMDILRTLQFESTLTHVVGAFDEQDDRGQKAGHYFARTIIVGVSASSLVMN